MTEKLQIKNSTKALLNTKNLALSIQFSLDGFSFCIRNTDTKESLYLSNYNFEETLKTPQSLLENIKRIFQENKHLQYDFDSIEVIHENHLSTIVPNEYFDESALASYLNLSIKTYKNDFIAFDKIESLGINNVYIPYVNINNYLFNSFGEFEYKHHQTVLLEKLLKLPNSEDKIMYVNVSKHYFDVIVLHNNNLVFLNSFHFKTKEDFIYYILFTAEQLALNPEEFKLLFSGIIAKDDELFKITYQFVRNVDFVKNTNAIFKNLELAHHTNYILLG